ncbi:hypothetical protein SHKM778_88720 [Streptomyces sp. KM77-8]|uniref:Acyclic terpene utilisation N-terminal domain-containing protein n=1 Tax=Streptomyces haneummycinicus TaxID=3074435 RepID=A0AAT9HZ64_9ACTN
MLKAGLNRLGGFRNEVVFVLTGLGIEAKAGLVKEQLGDALAKSPPAEVRWDLARTDRPDAATEETASALLRLVVGTPPRRRSDGCSAGPPSNSPWRATPVSMCWRHPARAPLWSLRGCVRPPGRRRPCGRPP